MPVGIVFEWDPIKAATNVDKHGVSFDEASTIFGDPHSLTIGDPEHSDLGDERFVTVGRSNGGRTLVVVHSDRNEAIRIISARPATRRERHQFEEGQ